LPSCPVPGRKLAFRAALGHHSAVPVPEDLVEHLVRSTPLTPGEARRVVAEVVGYFGEEVPEFVRRRHAELQRRGLTNDAIFGRLADELTSRRFAAPELSPRQLRRLVYG
jgi:hypothetical protein